MMFAKSICSIFISLLAASAFAQTPPPAPAKSSSPNPPNEIKLIEINSAARVVFVEGDVSVIGTNKQRRAAKVGETIFQGDNLVTGKDGELHLDMEDGGYIAVRPNTKLQIAQYQAKGEDSDMSMISLIEGRIRAVTGWIGKFNQPKYVVKTPNATIGIRGTDHETLVIPKGAKDAEGEAGTYDKVFAGGSTITTKQGRAEVNADQVGFVGHDAKAPRLLSRAPAFFRAARNEKLIEGKHALVQQRITERRESRRKEIKSRLENAAKMAAERRAAVQKRRDERESKVAP